MLTLDVLRSTSAGNCSVLRSSKASVLIDCGTGATAALKGQLTRPLDAMLITHVHTDHFAPAALKVAKEHRCPVYMHSKMLNDLDKHAYGRQLKAQLPQIYIKLHKGEAFDIADIHVESFELVHGAGPEGPAVKTLGFIFNGELGYMTDTGRVSAAVVEALAPVSTLLIEANHDVDMEKRQAKNLPGMEFKVARALSAFGHLSNEQCGQAIVQILKTQGTARKLKRVLLGHLSDTCNSHDRALQGVMDVLDDAGYGDMDVQVAVDEYASRVGV